MDIEDLIISVLRTAEAKELLTNEKISFYTCIAKYTPTSTASFADTACTGELCVCASDDSVAEILFFLLEGIFDHANPQKWYTQKLGNFDEDDGSVYDYWIDLFKEQYDMTKHNIEGPIVVHPSRDSIVSLSPSTCDIWTIPRILRIFN